MVRVPDWVVFIERRLEALVGATAADGFLWPQRCRRSPSGREDSRRQSRVDELYDLSLIDADRLVVVGATASTDSALGMPRGGVDGFVSLIDPITLTVSWVVRVGGTGDDALRAVALVDAHTIAAVGSTDGGACRLRAGGADGWLVIISVAGSVLRSECVGTAATDQLSDVAVTPDDAIWVTGTTDAASTTATVRRAAQGRAYDRAFTSQMRSVQGAIGPLRLLSNEISRGYGIAPDVEGNVYAVGETTALPSTMAPWLGILHPTPGAFRKHQRLGSTDPYVFALRNTQR